MISRKFVQRQSYLERIYIAHLQPKTCASPTADMRHKKKKRLWSQGFNPSPDNKQQRQTVEPVYTQEALAICCEYNMAVLLPLPTLPYLSFPSLRLPLFPLLAFLLSPNPQCATMVLVQE